jgi:hypothetical protein
MQKEANHVPHEKPAPKAEDGERIDPPKPAEAGPIRGARNISTSRVNWTRRRSGVRPERWRAHPVGSPLHGLPIALGWKERR